LAPKPPEGSRTTRNGRKVGIWRSIIKWRGYTMKVDQNQKFAEMVGVEVDNICDGNLLTDECLTISEPECLDCSKRKPIYPDYAADPRLVLREMMKRKDWPRFLDSIDGMHNCYDYGQEIVWRDWIEVKYLLDTTGKLRDKAIEWLKGRTP